MLITSAKAAAWLGTGSSAMLSETIHSLVDSGNQALLLVGLRGSMNSADGKYQYGYGKQIYFWSLISALGTFWFGAGVTFFHSVDDLVHPALTVDSIGPYVWAVLGFSFVVDGYVLLKTLRKVIATKPPGVSLSHFILNMRDPTTAAVVMEDGAACSGVLIAAAGIGASHFTGSPLWDGVAGLGISALMGTMGLYLVRLNQRYLLGRSVDAEIIAGIKEILMSRSSIEEVHSVQSQWNGPNSFSYKAEVAFDGESLSNM
jgi:zinc transporter 9